MLTMGFLAVSSDVHIVLSGSGFNSAMPFPTVQDAHTVKFMNRTMNPWSS